MLFNQQARDNPAPKLSGETEFGFLNRSSRPEIGAVRVMLEQLALGYPHGELAELTARIQSDQDREFNSAVFELLLYSTLRKLGYGLTPHPTLSNGTNKKPDFLVTAPNGSQFYLEAVLASEEDGKFDGKQRMIQTTLDAIRKARHDNFWVDVCYSGFPTTQPKSSKLVSALLGWLDTLDPDKAPKDSPTSARLTECYLWEHEGWNVRFTPRAISNARRGQSKSLMGAASRDLSFMDSAGAIREAVTSKGHRYGVLDKPYLIAVNFNTPFLDTTDEIQALFGSEALSISRADCEADTLQIEHLPDGAWNGPKGPQYTRISGAWIFNNLNAYSLANRRSTIYYNPWAAMPLPECLKCFPHSEVKNEILENHDGMTIREIFDVNPGWPTTPNS